jgi:hypothetical protein
MDYIIYVINILVYFSNIQLVYWIKDNTLSCALRFIVEKIQPIDYFARDLLVAMSLNAEKIQPIDWFEALFQVKVKVQVKVYVAQVQVQVHEVPLPIVGAQYVVVVVILRGKSGTCCLS